MLDLQFNNRLWDLVPAELATRSTRFSDESSNQTGGLIMSYPRLDFHGNSRHGQWDEDFWSMLLSGGLLILMLVAAIAMWRSTTTLQTTTLFEKATQETTRPTLPTVPY